MSLSLIFLLFFFPFSILFSIPLTSLCFCFDQEWMGGTDEGQEGWENPTIMEIFPVIPYEYNISVLRDGWIWMDGWSESDTHAHIYMHMYRQQHTYINEI